MHSPFLVCCVHPVLLPRRHEVRAREVRHAYGTRHTASPNARANAPPEQGRITVSAASLMRASRCACKTWPINASSARKVARLLQAPAAARLGRAMQVYVSARVCSLEAWCLCVACASLVLAVHVQCTCTASVLPARERSTSSGTRGRSLGRAWYRGALVEEPWESPSVPQEAAADCGRCGLGCK